MKNVIKLVKELIQIRKGMGFIFMIKYIFEIFNNLSEVLATKSLSIVDKQISQNNSFLKVQTQGYDFLLTPDAIPLIRELMLKNCYGFDMTRKYGTIIDLGANRGVFTVMAAKVSKIVISVECNKTEMPELYKKTMQLNDTNNACFINKFATNITNNETISLNSIIDEYKIKEISFLKIDIEGAEKSLFENNLEWLRLTKEISMEVHPCFGVDEQKMILILNRNGFRLSLLDKDLNEVRSLKTNGMGYIRAHR